MVVGDAHVFPASWLSHTSTTQIFFPKPLTTFLTCFCRGERQNMLERKFASTGDRIYIHQVMSPTRSPLSHPGRAKPWEKEKSAKPAFTATPFSYSDFSPFTNITMMSFNLFRNKPWFCRVCRTSLLKTLLRKGEIACDEQFLLFPQCFVPVWRNFFHFHKICYCLLQTLSVWKSVKFIVWERVKPHNIIVVCKMLTVWRNLNFII